MTTDQETLETMKAEFEAGNQLNSKELRYQVLRDYIRHEDSLINHRLTWLLVAEGLIFSAYGSIKREIIRIYLHSNIPPSGILDSQLIVLEKVELALEFSGFIIGLFGLMGILASCLSIQKISHTYKSVIDGILTVPSLTAGGEDRAHVLGWIAPPAVPIILSGAWAFILFPTKELLLSLGVLLMLVIVIWRRRIEKLGVGYFRRQP